MYNILDIRTPFYEKVIFSQIWMDLFLPKFQHFDGDIIDNLYIIIIIKAPYTLLNRNISERSIRYKLLL